ncbi:conjugative transfer ATPase [Denitromonas iodatirespirans]|uniref:Conjugative transfer ATPase n=1 Tax=Denitromonas iodatirespirans TaxID=2795389 RepID=A0A944D9F2_DENI1|nr:conjugative transfer ATPase [Denitromonas iodatirespirans]MBT0960332.1 conjugative transfer ATPase [Denitromonas iodatirespirans]
MFGFIKRVERPNAAPAAEEARPGRVHRKGLTVRERRRQAMRPPSFTDHMPVVDCLPGSGTFIFEDGLSRAMMFELTPIPTSTRSEDYLLARCREIQNAISSLPEHDTAPWVVQFYCNDDTELSAFVDQVRAYVIEVNGGPASDRASRIAESDLTRTVLEQLAEHFEQVSRDEGLFVDDLVSGEVWRGQIRRVRCAIYRRYPPGYDIAREREQPLDQLKLAADALIASLRETGITTRRMDRLDYWAWMLPYINPVPDYLGSVREMLDAFALPADGNVVPQFDLGEAIFTDWPESDPDEGIWRFGKRAFRAMALQHMQQSPEVGHFTAERAIADKQVARFDRLPVGAMLCATFVATPQDTMRARIGAIQMASRAQTAEAGHTYDEAEAVLERMAQRDKLFPCFLSVIVRGDDDARLSENVSAVQGSLSNAGLKFIDPRHELIGCDVFLRSLPMCFDPVFDEKHMRRSRLMFASQIAALLPLYGRARGTGSPGFMLWNRGGEPLLVDPLNRNDRKANGHLLVLGPTGAGKSATLNYLCMTTMAVHRPRMIIVDAGESFQLLGDFFAAHGLRVHRQHIAPGKPVSLPVFANAMQLLERDAGMSPETLEAAQDEQGEGDEEGDEERRDYLGEMVIQARLMITGGESAEEARMSRADQYLIAQAILNAALEAKRDGKPHPRVEDVARCLMAMRKATDLGEARRARAEEMGQAMMVFCDEGLRGEVFNGYGEDWPDADVIIVELGHFAREGYEDALAIAYTSLVNRVQSVIEASHYEGRPTIFLTDEGHIVTRNPLLSPFLVKATKMWRKLGAWFWLATQNMEDFPDQAARILNMCEWWLVLTLRNPNEIDEIARFRPLTEAQRKMIQDARKAAPKYTEGVLLNAMGEYLFRNVPPTLPLALAMTEQHEKAERGRIMRERGCSELEAAYEVARRLKEKRS